MKKEIRDKWVAALRSGKYYQGQGYLYREGKYCCLGVFADVFDLWTDKARLFGEVHGEISWINPLDCPFAPEENIQDFLIKLNDGSSLGEEVEDTRSFNEIADWIEEHVGIE